MTSLLIVGATGLVGRLALERAVADDRVGRVVTLTRRPIGSGGKVENVVVDFADLPDRADRWSVDGVVSAMGSTRATAGSPVAYRAIDHDYPLAVARLARAHGATRFAVVSSVGADPRSWLTYTRTKGELESELKGVGFPSLTIVRPSVLDGRREQRRPDERLARVVFKVLRPVLPQRLRVSPASAVAAALIEGAINAPPGVHVRHNDEM